MVFEIPHWKYRLESTKTQEEFAQLLKDLPDNPKDLTRKADQKSSYTEQHSISAPLILNTRKGKITVG
ncbi:MAG TPA: hypothetical protein VIO39_03740 [Methylotenera sp.]